MCERFARYQPVSAWVQAIGMDAGADLYADLRARDTGPRYNVTPGTRTWIAAFDDDGALTLDQHRWAFPTARGNRINVRSESAHRVPEYRRAFDRHRCVVLANGFYEPEGSKDVKDRPWFYFSPGDGAPLFLGAIAGPEGFSILTCEAVAPVADVHARSPVLIPTCDVLAWLEPSIRGAEALARFASIASSADLRGWRVGDAAKRPANEGPELIVPLG